MDILASLNAESVVRGVVTTPVPRTAQNKGCNPNHRAPWSAREGADRGCPQEPLVSTILESAPVSTLGTFGGVMLPVPILPLCKVLSRGLACCQVRPIWEVLLAAPISCVLLAAEVAAQRIGEAKWQRGQPPQREMRLEQIRLLRETPSMITTMISTSTYSSRCESRCGSYNGYCA